MILNKQFVFLIGAPRSGTTWLQAMLGAHPSICTTAELMLFNFYTVQWVNAWEEQRKLQKEGGPLGLPLLWTEDEFYGFLQEFLTRAYERVLAMKPEATILLDKHPGYSACVEHINTLIPHAKFIHIVRDGRDVVTSLLAASRGWGRLWAPDQAKAGAAEWKRLVRGAQKARQYNDRYYEVKYEELFTNGPALLQRLFEFIGVSVDLDESTAIFREHQFEKMQQQRTGASQFLLPEGFFRKGQRGDWRNVLSPTQKYELHEVAGDLLGELGYADESWWMEHWYHRFTLPFYDRSRRRKLLLVRIIKYLLGPKGTEWVYIMRNAFRKSQ